LLKFLNGQFVVSNWEKTVKVREYQRQAVGWPRYRTPNQRHSPAASIPIMLSTRHKLGSPHVRRGV
jgi:hypothetical protein